MAIGKQRRLLRRMSAKVARTFAPGHAPKRKTGDGTIAAASVKTVAVLPETLKPAGRRRAALFSKA
jgi:hypothetical protein